MIKFCYDRFMRERWIIMAKRKKKDTTSELLGGLVVFILVITYLTTYSMFAALLLSAMVLTVIVIVAAYMNAVRQKKINRSGILEVDKMSGVQFEKFLMLRYRSMGYIVKETPVSGDFGADLVLHKNSKKIVVQAKRYSKSVGLKAVQEVNSAKPHYKADEAWVVTNNYYTNAAKQLAETNDVKLINRDQLIEILSENVLRFK